MRTVHLTESTDRLVTLTDAEAADLRYIGRQLASQKQWWGSDPSEEQPRTQTVVSCVAESGTLYRVRIADAVGVIGLEQTQLIVDPKIPLGHLVYLFAESEQFPRQLLSRTRLGVSASFFSVVAMWFVGACEKLLRHGLVTDYSRVTGDLGCARGRIHAVATARSVLVGRPSIRCDYDLRGEDTPLNRTVKAAALRLLAWPGLSDELRARCRRVKYRFSDVGSLQAEDTLVQLDPLTRPYMDVHPLALMILSGSSMSIREGGRPLWTFLYRTPEVVEAGVRNTLSLRLAPRWSVTKRGLELTGTKKRRLNPDLIFGDSIAVGDVKYKHSSDSGISRSDLNQITTFATGYEVNAAVVIAFGGDEVGERVQVGSVDVCGLNWNTGEPEPSHSADRLAEHLDDWLRSSSAAIRG